MSDQLQIQSTDSRAQILVISPVKDEAIYLQTTIDSFVAQTLRPALWVIVDDGSTDQTTAIADAAALEHDWIRVVHRQPGEDRSVGPGVIQAFYVGLASVPDWQSYEFLCKTDGDLEFQPLYFEILIQRFRQNPRLGTASGKVLLLEDDGSFVPERIGDGFSFGCAKLYRRTCFEEIGGFVRQVMWDGIDCHRCRMLGWDAISYPDPDLSIKHFRRMGSSFKSIYHGRRRWGRGQNFMGTHPLYILGICAYRMFEKPYILGGLNILLGYLHAALTRAPRYQDSRFHTHLRHWQLAELGQRILGRTTQTIRPLPILQAELKSL
jgi:glycosyltransferase involved in cell wall biosynthesis